MQLEKVSNEIAPLSTEQINSLQSFQKALNAKPKKVYTESIGGQTFQHLPIGVIENLLKKYFFGLYRIQIVDYRMIVNEISVHVRIHVYHPILKDWLYYDGIAAVPVQQNSGSPVDQFMQTKKKDALHKNLPSAYAFAVKNAAKKIGAVFGADLNRKVEDAYVPFATEGNVLNQ
jgi:hypothetical protein